MAGKTPLLKITLIGWCAVSIHSIFTQDETEIIKSTLKLLGIGKCIFTSEIDDEMTKAEIKKMGENFISTGFMRLGLLERKLKTSKPPDTPTVIAIKVKTSLTARKLFVENVDRLHWFVWFLISLDDLDPRIRIPFNCQLFLIQKSPFRTYRLIEVFHVKNSSTYSKEFGVWAPGKGLVASSLNLYKRRTDLKGVHLEITACNRFSVEKPILQFWKESARVLNFTLQVKPPKHIKTKTGNMYLQNPDGTTCIWGITGLDVEKDWLFWTFGEKVKLVTKFRGTNDVGWKAYVQPFTKEIWAAVGVWFLLSTVALVIVNGCTKRSFYLNAFTALFCLCNSDPTVVHPPNEPLPLPTKLVHLMSLAVPAVIVPAYSAYILSTLSIILPLEPFNDIKEFIADGTYKLAAVENTFVVRQLRGSKDPDLKHIYDHLFVGVDNMAQTHKEMFEQLCKENKLAGLFIDDKSFYKLFRCRMFIMQQEVNTISTGLLLPKGSPFRKMLNERLAEYKEKGIKPSLVIIQSPFMEETEALNSLNMSQMKAIFILLTLGFFLSLTVLAVEMAVENGWNGSRILESFSSNHC